MCMRGTAVQVRLLRTPRATPCAQQHLLPGYSISCHSALAHCSAPRTPTALATPSRERPIPTLARRTSSTHLHHGAAYSPSKRCPTPAAPPSSLWSDRGAQSSRFTNTNRQGGRPRGVGALSMSGGGTGGDGKKEVAGGAAEKEDVPWVSWVSLAMLLLVYISNQWTRSLVYCEYSLV